MGQGACGAGVLVMDVGVMMPQEEQRVAVAATPGLGKHRPCCWGGVGVQCPPHALRGGGAARKGFSLRDEVGPPLVWGAGGHPAAEALPVPWGHPGLEVGVPAWHGGGDVGIVVGAGLSFESPCCVHGPEHRRQQSLEPPSPSVGWPLWGHSGVGGV